MSSVNSRVERPTLSGQRIKTRKRDEKEKHDPNGFRDTILTGINEIIQSSSPESSNKNGIGTGSTLKNSSSNHSSVSSNSVGYINSDQASPDSESITSSPALPSSPEHKPETVESNDSSVVTVNGSASVSSSPVVTKSRLEALTKFLEEKASKKDEFRKYGEVLFDILIAGGILAPGGTIVGDNDSARTSFCVFGCPTDDTESIKGFGQVIVRLVRRYKYLEKTLEEEVTKILKFLKGFKPEERERIARLTGILISSGQVPASVLSAAITDHSVKDGCSGEFLVTVLSAWKEEKSLEGKGESAAVWSSMKKSGMDQKLMDFFPSAKRTPEHLEKVFKENGLSDLLVYQKAAQEDRAKKELQAQITEIINGEGFKASDLLIPVSDAAAKNKMSEHEVVVLLWNSIMNNCEWSKKEEMVADQAVKRLTTFTGVLKNYTKTVRAEIALINRVQEFSYENMNFLKAFTKIIQLFYHKDVLTEDAILKWYKEAHSSRGKSVFLEQAKPFIDWLEAAEEESDED